QQPTPPRRPLAAPSPLELVAAIDYLDTVWQLAHGPGQHLFRFESLERPTKLAFPAQTAEEFDSRLSGFGELLREACDSLPKSSARNSRERPLRSFELYLVTMLGATADKARIRASVLSLEQV